MRIWSPPISIGSDSASRARSPRATARAAASCSTLVLADVRARQRRSEEGTQDRRDAIRVAVIGRPNVGKSTLVNRLIGEERVIASEQPGTTRDSILVPFERDGRDFVLVDTAGVRRRARVEDAIERASVAETLQAIAEAHVVVMVLDAHDNDRRAGCERARSGARARPRAADRGQQMGRHRRPEQREEIRRQLALKLDFVPFAPLHFISARHGTGVGELVRDVVRGYEGAMREMPTRSSRARSSARSRRISRRWYTAGASSCAMRTRADAIRRAS